MGFRDVPAAEAGLATYDGSGRLLDAWYPNPGLTAEPAEPGAPLKPTIDEHRAVKVEPIETRIASLADAPVDAADVYLRLHLLSHRLIRPHEANLEGIFGLLTNVVWTSHGPCAVEDFESTRARMRMHGQHVTVFGVDKFPRLVDYVVRGPDGATLDSDTAAGAHWMRIRSGTLAARSAAYVCGRR